MNPGARVNVFLLPWSLGRCCVQQPLTVKMTQTGQRVGRKEKVREAKSQHHPQNGA